MKLYSSDELLAEFKGKYVDTHPHHYAKWNEKKHVYETTYEVRGVSKVIRENYNLPEDCILPF